MNKSKLTALLVLALAVATPAFAAYGDATTGATGTSTSTTSGSTGSSEYTVLSVNTSTNDVTLDQNGTQRTVPASASTAGLKAGDKVTVDANGTVTKK
ncbi:MAG TPA: hypothetical protein VL404_09920 [Candidatus Eisenbacteria bacterium]|jgi:hypothetical protein|nr:hypothetical protein [Candidatus Eisenbacteria bacterium]